MFKKIKYEEYLKKWLNEKRIYIKESTYANYLTLISNYIIPKLGNYNINKLNHTIIQNYILDLYNNGINGLSIKTIKDTMCIIKGSLKDGFNQELLSSFNLDFSYPKTKNKTKYILNEEEQKKLTNYIFNNINNKNVGILLSLCLGIRIGEMCALRWEDIDFNQKFLCINKTLQRIYIKGNKPASKIIITAPKSNNSNRRIPINEELLCILKKIKSKNKYYVLTNSSKYIEPRVYRFYFNKILKELNINHFNYHSLRHSFATNCISLGIDYKTTSELLGHSNISITLNLYVHPRVDEKRNCIDTIYKNLTK